ncbi:MAG TPA: HDOD domain-containing protein [Polyangiales bacterium]|nr:HDOD domain-containing protein [Polyangiales bacterium]
MSKSVVGSKVDDYLITAQIGDGASGFVYSATHERTQRDVAFKILRGELATNGTIATRFLKEAKTINAIGHPNIVEVLGTGLYEARPYVVLELLHGETLEKRLERQNRLDVKEALPIFLECADALAAAHDRQIVHRDIKPENIFLAEKKSGGETTKLLDFGIAKLLDPETPGVTQRGAIIGTPQYMSPEQAMSEDTLDHRSDIYSLALVLYRMVTGELPYIVTNHHLMRYVLAHTQQPPRPPRTLVPELPVQLEVVLLKALSKQPDQRYPDLRAMAKDLAALRTAKETLSTVSILVDENFAAAMSPNAQQPRRAAAALARFVTEGIHSGNLQLPGLPTAALRCIEMLRNPRCNTAALVEVLGKDPLLASQVVGRANAALFASASPAKTLEQALGRLGQRALNTLLIEVSTRRVFESRDAGIRQAFQLMWDHSVAVAKIAQLLARKLKADPELSYLAGLLHDVGKPVVGAILLEAERVATTKQNAWHSREGWLELVSNCHREVGFAMARAWQLPDDVLFGIARSDRYSLDGTPTPVNLVCLANALAKRAGMNTRPVKPEEIDPVISEGMELFDLSEEDLAGIIEQVLPGEQQASTIRPQR